MKWDKEIEIEAPIDTVWALFDESHPQRIMPKVDTNEWIVKNEPLTGSSYKQTYREGKRTESYLVTISEFTDEPDHKKKTIQFVLANLFDTNLTFEMKKISEGWTHFRYIGSNEGMNFIGKTMLKIGKKQENGGPVVEEFVQRIKREAEKDARGGEHHEISTSTDESTREIRT
ncbi:SRPBCC family protein [Chryseomicrobium palamuruense]|uniref:SRPBCC family protein n=1 Tax=Chryseomicrobium palamuruense TaxID=682973 RepID=A0ABV8UT45_9BACL